MRRRIPHPALVVLATAAALAGSTPDGVRADAGARAVRLRDGGAHVQPIERSLRIVPSADSLRVVSGSGGTTAFALPAIRRLDFPRLATVRWEPIRAIGSTQRDGRPRLRVLGHPVGARGARVECRLDAPGRLTLTVHDVRGARVRTLIDEDRSTAGLHAIAWDGRDDAGRPLPSGAYLCRAESAGLAAGLRLVLVR